MQCKHADPCTHRIFLCHFRQEITFFSFRMNEAETQWQSWKFIFCLLVLSHAGFQLRAVIDFISLLIPNNWWSPSCYQLFEGSYILLRLPLRAAVCWALKSRLSQSLLSGDQRGKWAKSRDAGLLNKWEEEEWLFQIRRERQKWESKPFRKWWPPTPHTPTTTSPCLPGPIDPLIRYSQSPLLRRPPPQLSVRDGMWGTAPLRITIPVIYCYNTASHFRGGWLEWYRVAKGRGKGMISSPCLTPPTNTTTTMGRFVFCGRSHSARDTLGFERCDETAKNCHSRSHSTRQK